MKIALSWFILVVALIALLAFVGGIILAWLWSCQWLYNNTFGWWTILAALAVVMICFVLWTAINNGEDEE